MESQSFQNIESWTSQTLTYIAVTLVLVVVIKYLLSSSVPHNIPPFPARAYPILGHLPYLKNGSREQMDKWTKSTGEIFSLYFGSRLVVVLNSYDVLYQAFVKQGDKLSDRPPSAFIVNSANFNKGIVNSSGHIWKEQRTVALHILRSFGMGKNILAEKVSEEVSAYLTALSQLSGSPIEARTLTITAVSNIICSIIVGKRFEYDDAYFTKFMDIMNEQVRLFAANSLATVFRFVHYLPGDFFNAKKRSLNFQEIHTYFCEHYVKITESQYDENNLDNFISAYLFEMKKTERMGKDSSLDRSNLARVLGNLFVAGSETTSTTLLWFMVYMINFPQVQEKVFREIKEVVGLERAPAMQDRTKLNYTNAVILETQRLSSIVPLGVPHYSNEDTVINGYSIPAGTTVLSNLDAVLLSSDTWKDPLEFKPERFLDAQGNVTQPEQFVAYSIGRRVCLGEALARMELYLFVSGLIQRFELLPAEPGQPPLRKSDTGITSPPAKFCLRFKDRHES
ncbi:hypothetical protein EGW08_012306 [Elysia chlorotica]|uniref:Cytochrome P450 n=1 Tax=Elysia chlorotica TaxID=188477 RepID=A0A433TED0_ELYCH|nr:hypothetical protein EGW08_012306 [Elysia chlorotica]